MRPDLRHVSLPPRTLPGALPDSLEVFAIGDIHGQADLLAGCLEVIARTPRALGTERLVVFLWDIIDRGPDSLRAIDLAMDAAHVANADQSVLLPGNHELALLEAIDHDPETWLANGGKTVMREIDPQWDRTPWRHARELLRTAIPRRYVVAIETAPSHLRIGDLLFVHAGLAPCTPDDIHLARNCPVDDDTHWAWIRNEFLTWQGGWDVDPETGQRWIGPTVVVHGHTPAVRTSLAETTDELPQMDGVEDYRAICLDAGAAYRPQLGWARFFREGEKSVGRIGVVFVGWSG
ncbi:metallophosphoesterase [uncultured Jannaschia sp.]|uniref:metallophosphoesterase n=1 Tax=uncultured Jannaschia sp. TaxID=293347 RepID=UPI002626906B|nr:metallophosphoesterase [uncultured Jannaschia sp.]